MSFGQVATIAVIMLTAALAVCIKVAASRKKRSEGLESSLETARQEIRRLGEYYAKKEEAQRHAEEKKESLHTGDNAADFDNSLKVLHGAAGGGTAAGPGA
jgi:uncharacterized protein YlxW (UPF0749 family)